MEVRGPHLVEQISLSFDFYFYLLFFFSSADIIFVLFVLVGACVHQQHSFEKITCFTGV